MSDIRQSTRDFLIDFIELYKSCPCLWNVKSKEYSNRNSKTQAYGVLVEKYKEIDSTATRDTVKRKINSMRTTYRKELIKMVKSEVNGEIYKPSLWYFPMMDFLREEQIVRVSRSTFDDDSSSCDENHQVQEATDCPDTVHPSTRLSTASSSAGKRLTQKRKVSYDEDKSMEVAPLIGEKSRDTESDDKFTKFGNYIAEKLRIMDCNQSKFAEKLISEVLFEADMGCLHRDWKFTEVPDTNLNTSSEGKHFASTSSTDLNGY